MSAEKWRDLVAYHRSRDDLLNNRDHRAILYAARRLEELEDANHRLQGELRGADDEIKHQAATRSLYRSFLEANGQLKAFEAWAVTRGRK